VEENKNKQERRDSRKKAGGFATGLLMGGLAGAWAMLLVVGGWVLRGRLAPAEK